MASITLSAAVRSSLLSAKDTASLLATTQQHLSTGKKVNSALDNPTNFFTAAGLTSRASDLTNLLDGISNGIQTINAASQGITNIQKLVDTAKSTASQALATQITTTGTASSAYTASAQTLNLFVNGTAKTVSLLSTDTIDSAITKLNAQVGAGSFSKDTTGTKLVLNASSDVEFKDAASQTGIGFAIGTGTAVSYGTTTTAVAGVAQSADLVTSGVSARAALATQYNSLLTQIDQLAKDASYNGVNLINSAATTNKLHITFNQNDSSNVDVQGQDFTSNGIGLTGITANSGTNANQGNFLLDADIKATSNLLTSATNTLRTGSSTLGNSLSIVQNRQDFTKNIVNVLQTGSDALTSADLNEEAANSQALSTRQSLVVSAISLGDQANQSVLQLLR